jgi:hypothetical protein
MVLLSGPAATAQRPMDWDGTQWVLLDTLKPDTLHVWNVDSTQHWSYLMNTDTVRGWAVLLDSVVGSNVKACPAIRVRHAFYVEFFEDTPARDRIRPEDVFIFKIRE